MAALWLLVSVFRRAERWLHQHIFKVGWLLSNDFRITTIVYYIIFLPGIALHELTLWLAAGVLNVRAVRALQFPEEQDIGELRLNFVKLSHSASPRMHGLISLAPVLAGASALWAIATFVFDWRTAAAYAASGTIDGYGRALSSILGTTDLWIWLYLAFVIANTMFPIGLPWMTTAQKRITVSLPPVIVLLVWWLGGGLNAAIAINLEAILANLAFLFLQLTAMNIAGILVLGLIESASEKLTGRCAAFKDGKMLTMTRAEANEFRNRERSARRTKGVKRAVGDSLPPPVSVYGLRLPIPGPPGREPVSRHAVSVVDVGRSQAIAEPSAPSTSQQDAPPTNKMSARADRSAADLATRAPAVTPASLPDSRGSASTPDAHVPFSRPFVHVADEAETRPQADDEVSSTDDARFARPFALPNALALAPDDSTVDVEDPASTQGTTRIASAAGNMEAKAPIAAAAKYPREAPRIRTRAVPKPSRRKPDADADVETAGDGELTYEPDEEADVFDDDADAFDETL